jgi:guanylate kinase
MPEALFVFLAPPTWEELVRRLVGRGTEDEEERAVRLATARDELAAAQEFDVTVLNDDVRRAAEELVSLMRSPVPEAKRD